MAAKGGRFISDMRASKSPIGRMLMFCSGYENLVHLVLRSIFSNIANVCLYVMDDSTDGRLKCFTLT